MKRSLLLCIIFLIICSLFCSCAANSKKDAEEILLKICEDYSDLPSGVIYTKRAEEGDVGFLSSSMIKTLYGEGAPEYEFTFIEDFAIYISSFERPEEIAVIKCYSSSDTDTIAKMLLCRISQLCILLGDTELSSLPQNATVEIKGHFVIMKMINNK